MSLALSRRSFLASASAAAVVATMPAGGAALAASPASAPAAVLPAFVVGTPGEYDWHAYVAENAEQAFRMWVQDRGDDECEFDPEFVTRMPAWDGRDPDTIRPADWLRADLGHCCERCGYETHSDSGAQIVAGEVVCEECLTFADRVLCDPEDALDDLINRIADEGEEDTREWLEGAGHWRLAEADLWPKALAAVAAGDAA
ncbi:hypothetical protein [Allomesorhizobium alhagi]|uniref:Twin-arginine translocation pathway signal n=1 Tax=Mesorhizobium alhagi CCNWXJ12-2 TaxID=1107882 RepID=H0HQX1_9HYPH|nr:hypothetical protein [Mesorhizobium alhagi]EHK56833.1 hypothetical protein MAXJ12_12767 [Mesorhizobium alhagi CCNWXJ12-2]